MTAVYYISKNIFLKMVSPASFLLVAVISTFMPGSASVHTACSPFPSGEYRDVGMECVGPTVTSLPYLLPDSLNLLRLTNTSLSWLNSSDFQGRHLPKLSSFHVTHSKLRGVEAGALCSLPSLVQLILTHNELDQLDPMSLECNKNLRSLDLSSNPTLHNLPRLVSSSLEKLHAANCGLTYIEDGALDQLDHLNFLDLSGNPGLDCSSTRRRLSKQRPGLIVTCDDVFDNVTKPTTRSGNDTASATTAKTDLTDNTYNEKQDTSSSTSMISLYILLSALSVGTIFSIFYTIRRYINRRKQINKSILISTETLTCET